ncbi:lipid-A-disaccharide synthase N-terminal domain-containing protein [Aquiflexum gelatinilyticum]|uniref:Lipid-A-disaccharide synthase N-terminal domain-containing protein n=1 Tax=Aquiflexum gelatinilyticum TaxID=2961943 RepID=A0A9X2SX98_9BACT|nr:lipid-A-disaccharide synthase N-terminal domain-containing protein [Aquiflexum gelatinilyticum]MCR9013427.1 lipid-A-disaccharide synthase N-terminal domain-containing protein [Aquiflexum gelatinilyticum]
MNNLLVLGLGLTAQGLFAGRFVVQLLQTEKSQKVESPALFWKLSLLASFFLVVYGFIQNDIVIVGGQLIGYVIYIRNLQIKGDWGRLPYTVRLFAFMLPALLFSFLVFGLNFNWQNFMDNPEIDGLLLTWGTVGQVIFSSRFVIQWLHSEKLNESAFPISFWYISIAGALMISVYAIFRQDAVLFIGQAFGLVVYFRNMYIHYQPILKKPVSLVSKFRDFRLPTLMVFMGMVLFFNLGNWEVTEGSEARYAQISKEMLTSGDYIHPTLMGIYHYHKPPMTYWITSLAYKVFGISSWAARFILQIAILVQVMLVFQIGKLFFENRKTAFYAALIFASFSIIIVSGRALTTDAYLAVFVLAAMYSWFLYFKAQQRRHLLLFYLFLGLGFLTKGPVVLIVPVSVLLFQKISQKTKLGNLFGHLLGLGIFLIIGLSWFVLLYIEDRQFLDYFVFKHTIQRFSTNTFSRSQPFWYYFAIVGVTAFPWIWIILFQAKKILLERNKRLSLLLAWIFIPLVFFSLSQSKLVLYILPIFPAIALAGALIWSNLPEKSQVFWDKIQFWFHIIVILGLGFSPLLDPRIVLKYKFFFILVLTAALLISIRLVTIKSMDRAVLTAFLFIMGITAASTYFMGNNSGLVKDQKNVAAFINDELPEARHILVYNRRIPSMSFLTDKNIISLYDGSADLNRETQFQKDDLWKANLINLKDDPDWLSQKMPDQSVLMIKNDGKSPIMVQKAITLFPNQIELDGWLLFY